MSLSQIGTRVGKPAHSICRMRILNPRDSMTLRNVFAIAAMATVPACATGSKGSSTVPLTTEPGVPTWSGSLQPTQQRTGGLAVTGQNKVFGTVNITPSESRVQRMRVRLTIGAPVQGATSFRWAVLPDRCGTGQLPLLGFEQFPLIDVSTNGRGQIETELPLVLTAGASYHVNVYDGGQQLENVLTCANLKFEPAH